MQSQGLLSFPLMKFSKALDVTPDVQQYNWTHATHDIVVVIDDQSPFAGTGIAPSRALKVYQGNQVLECTPLEEEIRQAHEIIQTMRRNNMEVKGDQLPISAIVRCPLLAIRYRLPDRKIRRLQLKFASNQDFDVAVNHLRTLGLHMSASPAPAKSARSLAVAGPPCPPARLAETPNRPSTALANFAYSTIPAVSSPLAQHSFTFTPSQEEDVRARPASAHPALVPFDPPLEQFSRPNSSSSISAPFHSALSTIEEEVGSCTVRHNLAASTTQRKSSLDLLPPPRELPFGRSSPPKSAGSDGPGSRPSSGVMGPPPLPPSTLRNLENMAVVNNSDVSAHPMPSFMQELQSTSSTRPRSRQDSAQRLDLPALPTPTFVQDNEKSGRSSSPASSVTANAINCNNHPHCATTASAQNIVPQTSHAPASSDSAAMDRVWAELNNHNHATSQQNLDAYAMQSSEGRAATLNEMMVQLLEDDSFLTLVEDVSTCWATIGLGLGKPNI